MEKCRFDSMLFRRDLEYRCGLSKSMDSFGGPIENENTSVNKDTIINHMNKKIPNGINSNNYSYCNGDHLVGLRRYIRNFISDQTFFFRDSNRDLYSIYFDVENRIFETDNDHSFISEPKSSFYSYKNSSYPNNVSKSDDPHYDRYMYDTKYNWNNHITSCIDSYLRSQISTDSYILSSGVNSNDSYIYGYIRGESDKSSKSGSSNIRTSTDDSAKTLRKREFERALTEIRKRKKDLERALTQLKENKLKKILAEIKERKNDLERTLNQIQIRDRKSNLEITKKYKHLWVQCENCYGLNYKKFFKFQMNICEHCGRHLKMTSSDRIESSVDPGTWEPLDEDMVSRDPIKFHSREEPYKDRIDFTQRKTGLTDAVQTGVGRLNGIPVAIGVMDFQFMGGSMGSVVGEKITRLIEHATNKFLPLILVCASGGARMQEGSLSLMQMAKISSALYYYQSNKKLFYVSILSSPTTGGVTASFGMLGDIIIAEPKAYVAFAGKRVIEQTLNKTVPGVAQAAEYLFHKGLFDPIVPRNPLKGVLRELFQLHAFFPLNRKMKSKMKSRRALYP
uniref:acetyl-CoA carboxylase carboxyltransferase beta subunit n=1 Tax=Spyridium scortechinii TaxID=323973 RepID=UPI0020374074|nr:acetyl-CoA carboxylase carboxyltransferase beta subunit [Spyridium scortechinii]UQW88210.1 acetyl-CoA carboxylase carboxyltransferase beta subunit [Spyridium scortechinii]UQW88296.1 acetyl-CoA carboxylase carboxyltransferase beta subunit [Spyridium scortechinii]UQW88382.1 acetyl-CoA carboxylase carboxyltransferase beta subunit [Spyridium scortechinii]UQW93709.1 acetyl-CoA carboxylase carboxyltransferase beta subunit [Spyridium burragorang]